MLKKTALLTHSATPAQLPTLWAEVSASGSRTTHSLSPAYFPSLETAGNFWSYPSKSLYVAAWVADGHDIEVFLQSRTNRLRCGHAGELHRCCKGVRGMPRHAEGGQRLCRWTAKREACSLANEGSSSALYLGHRGCGASRRELVVWHRESSFSVLNCGDSRGLDEVGMESYNASLGWWCCIVQKEENRNSLSLIIA